MQIRRGLRPLRYQYKLGAAIFWRLARPGSLTDLYQHAYPGEDRRLAEGSFDGGPVPGCVERDLMVVVWA